MAAPALPAVSADRGTLRVTLGLAATETAVLTVGRLAPQKNLRMVADVAARLRDREDLTFLVAGDGPLWTALTGQVAAQRSRVRLLGARADVADLLEAADLALLTSTWEARALVAQEALLAGRPLVSTRVGGIAELVGDAALLVEPDDVAGAAAAVARLVDDPALRSELAAAGRRRAATWPDEDEVADDLVTAYAVVAGRTTRRRNAADGRPDRRRRTR